MPSRSRGHEFLRCQSIKASVFSDWFSQVQPPARAGVCGLAAVGVSGSVRPATGRWPAEADLDRRSAPAPGRHQHHDGDVTLWPYTQRGAVAPCWRCSGSTGAGPGPADGGHGREVQPACDTAVTWPPCPENRRQPDSLWPGHPAEPERQRLPADRNTGRPEVTCTVALTERSPRLSVSCLSCVTSATSPTIEALQGGAASVGAAN